MRFTKWFEGVLPKAHPAERAEPSFMEEVADIEAQHGKGTEIAEKLKNGAFKRWARREQIGIHFPKL